MVDLRKLRKQWQKSTPNPEEMSLRFPKSPSFDDLWSSQADAPKQWFSRRTERDIVIKLNTKAHGSGRQYSDDFPVEWIISRDRELDVLLPDAGCRPQCGLGCHNPRDHPIGLTQVEGDFFLAIPEILHGMILRLQSGWIIPRNSHRRWISSRGADQDHRWQG